MSQSWDNVASMHDQLKGSVEKGDKSYFDKMEFCMLLLRSTHLLFARNVLSTHTQSFWVIRNNYLNANFSKSRNFYPQRVYASDDHFQIFENGSKILLLTTLKYCVCNALCLKQCLKSFIAPKQRYRQQCMSILKCLFSQKY